MVASASRTNARLPACTSGINRAAFEHARGHPRAAAGHTRRQQRRIPLHGGIVARARVLCANTSRNNARHPARAASGINRALFVRTRGHPRVASALPARSASGINRAVFVRTRGHPRVASALPARAASGINRAVFVRTRGHPRVAGALPARAASGINRAVFVHTRGHPRVAEHARRQQRRIPPDGGIAARARAPQRVGLRKTGTRADRATAEARAVISL